MKKILFLFLLVSSFSFSQQNSLTAKLENSGQFKENKVNGKFTFIFPKDLKPEEINKNAQFYVNYFTVQINKRNEVITITMLENSQKNRQIIQRFLLANNIKSIDIDNKIISVSQFYNEYLK